MSELRLGFGFRFEDLYEQAGLARIDQAFLERLNADLKGKLGAARANPDGLDRKASAELMLALAPEIDRFVGALFGIEKELAALTARQKATDALFACKRNFVQRVAAKAYTAEQAAGFDGAGLEKDLAKRFGGTFDQFTFAAKVGAWQKAAEANAEALDLASRYAAWACYTEAGRKKHHEDVLFGLIHKTDYGKLVHYDRIVAHGVEMLVQPKGEPYYRREGFHLTDTGCNLVGGMDQINYCVICHERERDFCSRGMREKQGSGFQKNPLDVKLPGCPLEERISEMHKAKLDGQAIASLAIICADNPMAAGTGHRICNDCMKSCIFQKQEPVNIPQAETRVLKDVLEMPWGFEVYGLLTRWNPTNFARPVAKPASGYKVLVVGLGPAGLTLSHHLLNEGHTVVAIDGLKVEPLPGALSGVGRRGEAVPFKPIREVKELWEDLDDRAMAGFGGVAEYGITVRWDKNFLKVLRLLLERRRSFAMYGGVRFGSTLTDETAFQLGFDHIALCAGAGKPTFLSVPNGLARGVRQASDFLMGLQLTGAAKKDSVANLQLRLPVVVIGGGLTAIDTATEALAYYVRQVEKFQSRFAILCKENGEEAVRKAWSPEEREIAEEFLAHAQAIGNERAAAKRENRAPKLIELLDSWGGATIAYRRRMTDSPSYTLNHEEIIKAFEQGMKFAELLAPVAVEVDAHDHCKAIRLARQHQDENGKLRGTGEEVTLPARAIMVAAGTQPNTTLARELPGFAQMDGKYYQALGENGEKVKPQWVTKPDPVHVLIRSDERGALSFFGDLHPSFAGNVVSAMASAKQGYPVVGRVLAKRPPSKVSGADLIAALNDGLRATVEKVLRLTPNIVEVIVRAPFAARAFKPGQFFRLQNFEADAARVGDTTLAMEGLALTGAWVDTAKGLVSVIVLEMGGSSNLCAQLQPGQNVVLMGPTGAPTHITAGETVLLAGGGLGNAVLFSIGQAFRAAGSKVLYFAGYKSPKDRYHVEDILKAADKVIWCCDVESDFVAERPQDRVITGNIVEAMVAYGEGKLGPTEIPLDTVDRIIAIGSDRMMAAVGEARHTRLKSYLKTHEAIASINSPMQCMMKEICAQCLQPHKDPKTGEESVVFTCFNQDQPIDHVLFPALRQRLCQNAVPEKLTAQWLQRCLGQLPAGV